MKPGAYRCNLDKQCYMILKAVRIAYTKDSAGEIGGTVF
jgi:hypothetical protein